MTDCPRCAELQGRLDLCAALSKSTSLNLQARIAQLELDLMAFTQAREATNTEPCE